MPLNSSTIWFSLSVNPSPLSERFHWRGPAGSEHVLCRPGTINLRLSAFICGSFFAEAPDINYSVFIKIWASQNSSPQNHLIHFSIRANPCHPCKQCSTPATFLAEAPQINRKLFINNRRARYSSAPGVHIRFSCALPEPDPSPLPFELRHWRGPAGSQIACCKKSFRAVLEVSK
ncbi:Uncharacterised protein [uncultured archaeon]|nr:Uncharacterised protein [uncultured archaeon]